MSEPSSFRVAVIGGGLSGLATAAQLHLREPSLELSLYESSDRLGGVIQTEHTGGFLVDHGADMFAVQPSAALDLCQRLSLTDQLLEPESSRRGARIVRGGKLVRVPEGFVLARATRLWPMITTPLLSPIGKLRLLGEGLVRPRLTDEDESVAQFVRRRMGKEVLDRIVAPLAAGIYTSDVDRLSMRSTMSLIAKLETEYGSLTRATLARQRCGKDDVERSSTGARYGQFRAFRSGMAALIRGMSESLPDRTIRLNQPVRGLRCHDESAEVTTTAGTEVFDHVVVATPPAPASVLLDSVAPEAAGRLRQIESASTAIVVLGVRREDVAGDIDAFGFVVPLGEGRRILAGSFASHKFAGRAPDGNVLIRVFIGGAMQSELLDRSDAELVEIAREELQELIGLTGRPVLERVVRWTDAMPQYHVGHAEKVATIETEIDKIKPLSLVSNALHGVGIAPVIQSAGRVADRIATSLARPGIRDG